MRHNAGMYSCRRPYKCEKPPWCPTLHGDAVKKRASASASKRERSVHGNRQWSETCLQVPALLRLVCVLPSIFGIVHYLPPLVFTSYFLSSTKAISWRVSALCTVLSLVFGAVSTKTRIAFGTFVPTHPLFHFSILVHWIWYARPMAFLKHPRWHHQHLTCLTPQRGLLFTNV